MAKIKTTLTAEDCARYGAILFPTVKIKYSFSNTKALIGLITENNGTSNISWAMNYSGDVAPLDAVRKCQTRIMWVDGWLVSDTDAITEQELFWAQSSIQETLGWI